MLKNIQLHRAGLPGVHVPHVFSRPAKGLSRNNLQPVEVDAAAFQKLDVLLGKILTDNSDQVDRTEIRCCDSPVGGRAAQEIGMLLHLSLDVVEGYGTDNEDGHRY